MLLFQKRFHAGIVDGAVRLTFRLWEKPHVKVGGRYRVHPIGVVEVNSVERVTVGDITEADARAGGFESLAELLAYMALAPKALGPTAHGGRQTPLTGTTPVFRVGFVHGGDGDRVASALETELSDEALADLVKRVGRLEREGKWVRKVLELIGKHPQIAASKLAVKLKREKEEFKIDVRKLKKLGLTQSFEVGYEVSPRGKKFLALTGKKKKGRAPARASVPRVTGRHGR